MRACVLFNMKAYFISYLLYRATYGSDQSGRSKTRLLAGGPGVYVLGDLMMMMMVDVLRPLLCTR